MVSNYTLIYSYLPIALTIYFGVLQIGEPVLKKLKYFKNLYLDSWFADVKVYIFSDIKITDIGCSGVNIQTDKKYGDVNRSLSYIIPFKICLPGDEKVEDNLQKIEIEFQTQDLIDLELFDSSSNFLPRVEIKSPTNGAGFQGKYFLWIIPGNNQGIHINVKIEAKLYKKSDRRTLLRKSQIIINGMETSLFETKIE